MSELTAAEIRKHMHILAPYDQTQIDRHAQIVRNAFASYKGTFDEIEAAIGMLHLGPHIGWKPLVMIHNKRTIRKYEEILGINIREEFPEEGPSAERSRGYRIAKRLGNFWKVVSGELKDDELKANRREIA